jgi:tetratricopeptide (TPR) repeat protein
MTMDDPLLTTHRTEIAGLVAEARLPAIYAMQDWVDSGGLLAYGPDREELGQLVASHVVKVLNGARPDDLPVAEPTHARLVANASAAQALDLTIRQTPKDFLDRARFRASQEDLKGATQDVTIALSLNPKSPLAYQERGSYRSASGDQHGAIEDFNVALELYPGYAEAYYGRGLAHDRLVDTRASFEDYTRAIQANPRYTWAYLRRGNARYAQDLLGAIDDYTQALRIDPDYHVAYHNRGLAHADLRNSAQALEDFGEALRIRPDYTQTYVGRAALLAGQGDVYGARRDLEQATMLFLQQGQLRPYQKVAQAVVMIDEFLGGAMDNYGAILETLTALRTELA